LSDRELLALYEKRDESAIAQTQSKYGAYCLTIALNILGNREDADECVNDSLLNAWEAIPPEHPQIFSAFLGRIVRNIALNRHKAQAAQKRGGGEASLLLSELEDCVPSVNNVAQAVEAGELMCLIKECLDTLKPHDKAFFIRRYWHCASVPEMVRFFDASEGKITMSLSRTRGKIKTYLEKRGITL